MSPAMLSIVGEKFLPSRCRPGTLSYCPTMDLVAVVTVLDLPGHGGRRSEEKLSVWRLNGQQVFGWDAPTGMAIPFLRWKTDGRLIALGTSDGVVRLLNVMNGGKMVHCLRSPALVGSLGRAELGCLAWGVNFGDVKSVKGLVGNVTFDDLLCFGGGKDGLAEMKADLPRELACGLDVEASIPKLSTLPPGTGAGGDWGFEGAGGDDDVFSSRASIDTIFHSQNSTASRSHRYDEVDVLLTGSEDGKVYIRIFDCFDIGMVDLAPSLPRGISTSKVLQHIIHPLSSTHALLVQTSTKKGDGELHVLALDLNFIPQTTPYYLSTLATKSTQLLNLLRYLMQTALHLSIELRGAFDLPSKFIRNINDTLAQSPDGPTDFVTASYQLVVTGECSDELRDWMIDEIGERNLKRWEKASLLGLETIRRLVHECLLPAIERCQVVLSRLEGLSRFAKSAQVLGLDTHSLNRFMDTVDCLNLIGHYLLKTVGKEITQFSAFIRWLRLEVEIQGLERENAGGPGSERLDEVCMRRDELDARTVLDYIQGVMGKSGMVAFVRPSVDARGSSLEGQPFDWSQNQVHVGFYGVFKEMLKKSPQPGKRPVLDDLLRRLKGQAQEVFDGIAQTLRKNILHRRICTLRSDSDARVSPARIVVKDEDFVVVIATGQKEDAAKMSLHRVPLKATSPDRRYEAGELRTPGDQTILDMRFIDDRELMVLSTGPESAHLHTVNYTSVDPEWQERHTFDLSGGRSAPSELDVNGRKGRRAACVLEDGIKFTIFDLDSGSLDEEMQAGDQDVVMV